VIPGRHVACVSLSGKGWYPKKTTDLVLAQRESLHANVWIKPDRGDT
jgi:hypothetical protein